MPMQLTILMEDTGKFGLQATPGVIENKVMAYGMLELAKEAVQDWHQKQGESRIVAPPEGFNANPFAPKN